MASITASSGVTASGKSDAPPALLSVRKVAKHFGKNIVLKDVSLEIAEGEFLTILGESGSGKTTLLRIIAGFETASSGEVWMGAERLDVQPPYRRRVNTVFSTTRSFHTSRWNRTWDTAYAWPSGPMRKSPHVWRMRWPK